MAKVRLLIAIGTLFFLSACLEEDNTVSSVTTYKSGSGQLNFVDFDGSEGILSYTHAIGSVPQDVYFIFTNTGFSDSYDKIKVARQTRHSQVDQPQLEIEHHDSGFDAFTSDFQEEMPVIRDRPEIEGLSTDPADVAEGFGAGFDREASTRQTQASEGDTHDFLDWDFYDTNSAITISATLRRRVDVSEDIVLNLWVENDSWGIGCDNSPCMNSTMVQAYGDAFLKAGDNNDIYNWMTSLYGVPWGSHSKSGYIDASAASEIDILFYKIPDESVSGNIIGYFWSKDNAYYNPGGTSNYTQVSNERLMFYIDSVLAATPQGSWDINDHYPSETVSTLAHEFQHMIHFYQKTIKRTGTNSDTWLNEMCSLVAEDLIADKIQANGPRGVAYNDYTDGTTDISDGRLPWFNYQNYLGLVDWYSGTGTLYSYGVSYAFGAYLARNYGGAALFKSILQNNYSDYRAVTTGLAAQGYSISFDQLLKRWGAAVLLSDRTSNSSGYRYNIGGSFDSTTDSIGYQLGSINLFNYSPEPSITDSSQFTISNHYKTSNRYVQVGSAMTGSDTWTIQMPEDIQLTVVTKDSE